MSFLKKLLKFFLGLIIGIVLFLFAASQIVPPVTRALWDVPAIEARLKTRMLPSDQPGVVRLKKKEKKIFRAAHLDTYLGVAGSTVLQLPRYLYDYLKLSKPEPRRVRLEDFGLFVDGNRTSPIETMRRLDELGVRSVAIRIYVTRKYLESEAYRKNLELARRLKKSGKTLMLVLAQLNESFTPALPKMLGAAVRDFAPWADSYQIAETVNRSKWGMWSPERYHRFIDGAFAAIDRYDPDAKTVGPGVIDFEWYYTLYFWSLAEGRFDILNALLYVDRVRQPENLQYGFGTEKKIRVMKAVAPEKPLWITEVNWPLSGTGRYKPTSEKEAVSPEAYRDYMLRYLIIALAGGYAERVYWWQLYARGYGLIDHLEDRKPYPAYAYFGALLRLLDGALPTARDRDVPHYRYFFAKGEKSFGLFWNKDGVSSPVPEGWECRDLVSRKPLKRYGATPVVCEEKR